MGTASVIYNPDGGLTFSVSVPAPSASIPGAPFSPTQIAGLVLWLAADQGVTLNSGNVSTWADQSGAGCDFTQGTAGSQPLFVASAINGLPGVTGIASSNRLLASSKVGTSIGVTTAGTRFTVLQTSNPGANQPYEQNWGTGSSLDYISFDGDTYSGFANSTRYNWAQTINANTTYILQETSAAGSYSVSINGSVVFTSGTNTVAMSGSAPQFLFSQAASTVLVTIGECLVYNSALSGANATLVYNYLLRRWA